MGLETGNIIQVQKLDKEKGITNSRQRARLALSKIVKLVFATDKPGGGIVQDGEV